MTERKAMIKTLDKLVSQIVRKRGRCEMCSRTDTLQAAHIFSRRNFNVRFDLENLLCLCYRCHFHIAHKEPVRFVSFVKEKLGEVKFKQLQIRADTSAKGQDLKLIKLYLEQKL